jgi:hypothetical protein
MHSTSLPRSLPPPPFAVPCLPLSAWPESLCPFRILALLSCLYCGRFLGWCIVVLSLCASFLVRIISRNPGTPLVLSPTPHHMPPSEPGTWGDLWSAGQHLPATGPAGAPHAPLRAAEAPGRPLYRPNAQGRISRPFCASSPGSKPGEQTLHVLCQRNVPLLCIYGLVYANSLASSSLRRLARAAFGARASLRPSPCTSRRALPSS